MSLSRTISETVALVYELCAFELNNVSNATKLRPAMRNMT